MGRGVIRTALTRMVAILFMAVAIALAPASPAWAQTFRAPQSPQPPTYAQISFPTVPTHFCSSEEYWKFINEVINPQVLRAAENAEAAARFRSQVEQAVNAYVQADQPVPAGLRALRRRAQDEFARQQQIYDRLAKLRGTAGRTPIIDCSKKQKEGSSVGTVGTPRGPFDISPEEQDVREKVWRAYRRYEDGRERCDAAQMAEALAELERLAKLAQEIFNSIAGSMMGGPFPDQDPPPQDWPYYDAQADLKTAEMLRDRARRARAQDCVPCLPPPPAARIAAAPPARPFVHAERALATWVNDTDRLFDQLGEAVQQKDCARIQELVKQISERFGRSRNLWWAALIPAQYRLKWKWIYLKAAEACRPPPDESETILDEIDEVPVISQAPTDRNSAALLAYHNQLRARVGSPPLRWSPALAANAGEYARVLADTGQLQHSSRAGREKTERENIIVGRRGVSSPMAMAQTWGNEQRLFRPGIFPTVCAGDWSTCAHYTQMVWSTTQEVGCSFASGRQFDALVCRYSPPGNRDGRPVVEPGLLAARRICPPAQLMAPPPPP